jgi:membrane protein implicated in regulation of membrane protease activity
LESNAVIVLVALTVGLVWWITAWAFGVKAFDAFLLTAFLVVSAAAYMLVKPYLAQRLGREAAPTEERGAGF